jgi:hypothetical protein
MSSSQLQAERGGEVEREVSEWGKCTGEVRGQSSTSEHVEADRQVGQRAGSRQRSHCADRPTHMMKGKKKT